METVKNKTFNIPSVEELGFDPVVLRKKYAEEREKRLRKDGNAQYQEVTGDFDQYNLDPYVSEKIVREPVTEIIDAAIIGGGFGGLLAAVRLLEAGIKNIRIIEKACSKKANLKLLPMQPGDVLETFADIEHSKEELGFSPKTNLDEGIPRFVEWFRKYHK